MIYSAATPIGDLPCYLPEIGGYFMSKGEQRDVYLSLKAKRTEIRNEIQAIETTMKAAAPFFGTLNRSLAGCQVGNLDWGFYQKLISDLPIKATRYEALKLQVADIEAQLDGFVGME
jgi:hypothetical protein